MKKIVCPLRVPNVVKAFLPFIASGILLTACERGKAPVNVWPDYNADRAIPMDRDYQPQAKICTWQNDKKAAYTIAFDDSRPSHYQIAAGELRIRGIVGTFNLNTQGISYWALWQKLLDQGNEIGSHTRSHVDCTKLSESKLHQELSMAKADIIGHLRGVDDVLSFTYPMGAFNDRVAKIVSYYHSSARGGGGINHNCPTDSELFRLKGIGAYPPYDVPAINNWVEKCIQSRGWIIVYFHSVSKDGRIGDTTIPLSLFKQHLDYVTAKRDSLWIATQGQVASYIRLRRAAEIKVATLEDKIITLSLQGKFPRERIAPGSKLSVLLPLPNNWQAHRLVIRDMIAKKTEIVSPATGQLLYKLAPDQTVLVSAEN